MIDRLNVTSVAWSFVLALAVCGSAAHADSVIHVNWAAPDGGDGTSWEAAYNDLHDALAAAISGDELWITSGVYTPDGPSGDRSRSFEVGGGVRVFGGFAGDEVERAERDWVVNVTILSGDLNGDDGPNFENNGDNSYHVVVVQESDTAAMVNGFTITAGYGRDALRDGAGIRVEYATLQARHCTFIANKARQGGGIYAEWSAVELRDCRFRGNDAYHGGGVEIRHGTTVTMAECSFADNHADVGAGLATGVLETIELTNCAFIGNRSAGGGGGGAFIFEAVEMTVAGCTFIDNDTGTANGAGGGLLLGNGIATIQDCLFAANVAGFIGAGMASSADATIINCVFSRGISSSGGGIYTAEDITVINCTMSYNEGSGVSGDADAQITLHNSILWGNIPSQVQTHSPGSADFAAFFCDVQDGWFYPGSNNIDADPLFVQAGADNVRISEGSPCLNAGDNTAVPPDVETDLDGNPRIQDGVVDLGAYEGEFEQLPASAVALDLDAGEVEFLALNGVGFHPDEYDTVVVRNYTGADDATMSVTEVPGDGLTGADGFSVLGTVLEVETTMNDGEFGNNISMVFVDEDLGGVNPLELDVTYLDESAGTWALAVSGNTANSPGHPRPIGDRIVVEGPGNWGISNALGDWGVYYDPQAGRGFAWANVDFAGTIAFGVPLCPADVVQPPNGSVDFDDLRPLLFAWGDGLGPYDIDNDGTVDVVDLLLLLDSWGGCP